MDRDLSDLMEFFHGIFLNQLYKYREVDSACFYNSRGPGKNRKNCSDLKFGQKEGPKNRKFLKY